MIELSETQRRNLDAELSALRHLTPAERELWHAARTTGELSEDTLDALRAELASLPSATPTPTERELLA